MVGQGEGLLRRSGEARIRVVPQPARDRAFLHGGQRDAAVIVVRGERGGGGDRVGHRGRVGPARPGGGEGDGVTPHGHVGVDRVLLGRGAAVAEVPGPAARAAGRGVGEFHGERHPARRGVGGEVGGRRGLIGRCGDVAGLCYGVAPAVVCGGQGDGVRPLGLVGVGRVLLGRGLAVAEVPEPRGRGVRGRVREPDGQRGVARSRGRAEGGEGCGDAFTDGYAVRLYLAVAPKGVRDGEVDRVGAGGGIGVRRVLLGRVRAVAEVPEPRGRRADRGVVEPDGERRRAGDGGRGEAGIGRSLLGDLEDGYGKVLVPVADDPKFVGAVLQGALDIVILERGVCAAASGACRALIVEEDTVLSVIIPGGQDRRHLCGDEVGRGRVAEHGIRDIRIGRDRNVAIEAVAAFVQPDLPIRLIGFFVDHNENRAVLHAARAGYDGSVVAAYDEVRRHVEYGLPVHAVDPVKVEGDGVLAFVAVELDGVSRSVPIPGPGLVEPGREDLRVSRYRQVLGCVRDRTGPAVTDPGRGIYHADMPFLVDAGLQIVAGVVPAAVVVVAARGDRHVRVLVVGLVAFGHGIFGVHDNLKRRLSILPVYLVDNADGRGASRGKRRDIEDRRGVVQGEVDLERTGVGGARVHNRDGDVVVYVGVEGADGGDREVRVCCGCRDEIGFHDAGRPARAGDGEVDRVGAAGRIGVRRVRLGAVDDAVVLEVPGIGRDRPRARRPGGERHGHGRLAGEGANRKPGAGGDCIRPAVDRAVVPDAHERGGVVAETVRERIRGVPDAVGIGIGAGVIAAPVVPQYSGSTGVVVGVGEGFGRDPVLGRRGWGTPNPSGTSIPDYGVLVYPIGLCVFVELNTNPVVVYDRIPGDGVVCSIFNNRYHATLAISHIGDGVILNQVGRTTSADGNSTIASGYPVVTNLIKGSKIQEWYRSGTHCHIIFNEVVGRSGVNFNASNT